ncbi:MAG: hypothetical protein WCE21_01855 [Candidatus Babeliales bacterium]
MIPLRASSLLINCSDIPLFFFSSISSLSHYCSHWHCHYYSY